MFLNPYINQEDFEFYENVEAFSKEKLFPTVEKRDSLAKWDNEIWKELGKTGLGGIIVPEKYGGQSASCLQTCLASEALTSGSADGGLILAWGAHSIIGTLPIVLFGTDRQKEKYLPRLATGEWIAGLGLTEPGSGSDAAGLISRAEDKGDHFVVNGSKMFITNGPVGDIFICMIRTKTGSSRGPMGISALIIEKGMKGFQTGKELHKLGMHTSTTSELIFNDMIVPKENLLGPLHSGFMRIGKATLEWERTVLVSTTIGMNQFVLDRTLKYSIQRKQFGKPIIDFYAIKEKLAKNWVYLQCSRRYIYYVASSKDKGQSLPMQASILKLITTEPGEEVAHEGVQILGGYGYMKEYHLERIYRDCKLGTIGAGSSEVMRSIVTSSFPGYDKFRESMNMMYDPAQIKKAEMQYIKSISGELELIDSIEQLLKDTAKIVKKSSHQSLAFAFCDLVIIYSVVKQSYWDCAEDSRDYKISDKKRDLVLLLWFLMNKYIKSFHFLKTVSPRTATMVIENYLNLVNMEQHVENCVEYLKGGLN